MSSSQNSCHSPTGELGDVSVTVEGGPGVSNQATAAYDRGACVVPLKLTGGAGGGMFGSPPMEKPDGVTEEQWDLLQTTIAPVEEAAQASAEIIGAVVASKSKVLVTGGTGLLGRALVPELVAQGFQVTVVSSSPSEDLHLEVNHLFEKFNVQHKCMNLARPDSPDELKRFIKTSNERFLIVINLAADRGGVSSIGGARTMNNRQLNQLMPGHLGEICKDLGVKMIHLSTEYVFTGEKNDKDGYHEGDINDEDLPFVKDGKGAPYAVQKYEAEKALMDKSKSDIYIVRVPVLYGPMLHPLEDGTASASISNFLGANSWAHDTWQRRYPTDARDVAHFLAAFTAKVVRGPPPPFRVYHYGAQQSVSKHRFLEMFLEVAGFPEEEKSKIMREDASERTTRPPYDVKLNIHEARCELKGNWREPSELSLKVIKDVWLPHFKNKIDEHMAFRVKALLELDEATNGSDIGTLKCAMEKAKLVDDLLQREEMQNAGERLKILEEEAISEMVKATNSSDRETLKCAIEKVKVIDVMRQAAEMKNAVERLKVLESDANSYAGTGIHPNASGYSTISRVVGKLWDEGGVPQSQAISTPAGTGQFAERLPASTAASGGSELPAIRAKRRLAVAGAASDCSALPEAIFEGACQDVWQLIMATNEQNLSLYEESVKLANQLLADQMLAKQSAAKRRRT